MSQLGYWDGKYIDILRLLINEFSHDQKLYKLFSDHLPSLAPFGVWVPSGLMNVSWTEYDKKDQAWKDSLWLELLDFFSKPLPPILEHNGLLSLSKRFNISQIQQRIVSFFFLYDRYSTFTEFLDSGSESQRMTMIEKYTGVSRNILVEECRPFSKLVLDGILSNNCHPCFEFNRYNIRVSISEHVSFFLDDTHDKSLSSFVLESPGSESYPLSSFGLPEETIASARAALMRTGPAFILLYGEAGTGKTELSKALPHSCGIEPLYMQNDRVDGSRPITLLFIAAKLVDYENEVLIVDECDVLLNSAEPNGPKAGPSTLKSMVNQFLDNARCKMIFITNQINGIPPSVLRRMHVLISFKPATFIQRKKMWDMIDERTPLFEPKDRVSLSRDYKANPARIRQVYDVCAVLRDQGNPQPLILGAAKDMLARSGEILYGIPHRRTNNSENIDTGFLNLSIPVETLLYRLRAWREASDAQIEGINLLFFGLPGTGKSALARYLAKELSLPPFMKKASDLLSPFVGETEARIRDAFEEAEGGVLIVDEADSFIINRGKSEHSWERTRSNEFLTQMEDFRGLFIATTNFSSALDVASFRRFSFKIEFLTPSPAQRIAMARHFFPSTVWDEKSLSDVGRLAGLVPGDYKAVARRLAYDDCSDPNSIITELHEELETRGPQIKRIGFSA